MRILHCFLHKYTISWAHTDIRNVVTVQYLHSYESKSIENRLWRWDFALPVSGFWHFHAKTPRGTVGSE